MPHLSNLHLINLLWAGYTPLSHAHRIILLTAMGAIVLYLVCIIIAVVSTVCAQPEGTCQACNCQLNNAEALNQLIQSNIRSGKP